MRHYFGLVGVEEKALWVGGGEWKWLGADGCEWRLVHCLIMPVINKNSTS